MLAAPVATPADSHRKILNRRAVAIGAKTDVFLEILPVDAKRQTLVEALALTKWHNCARAEQFTLADHAGTTNHRDVTVRINAVGEQLDLADPSQIVARYYRAVLGAAGSGLPQIGRAPGRDRGGQLG